MKARKAPAIRYPRQANHVVSKTLGNKAILLNLWDGEYFELNSSGHLIWGLCDGTRIQDEVLRDAVARQGLAEGDARKLRRDLRRFLATLEKRGLLEFAAKKGLIPRAAAFKGHRGAPVRVR